MRRVATALSLGRVRVRYVDGRTEAIPLDETSATVVWSIAIVHDWQASTPAWPDPAEAPSPRSAPRRRAPLAPRRGPTAAAGPPSKPRRSQRHATPTTSSRPT